MARTYARAARTFDYDHQGRGPLIEEVILADGRPRTCYRKRQSGTDLNPRRLRRLERISVREIFLTVASAARTRGSWTPAQLREGFEPEPA